jgi:hypothetical protein
MGMYERGPGIGTVVFEDYGIPHRLDVSPVLESLLVGFEDQSGMVVGKLRDALDMERGLDDDLVSSSRLLAHEQIASGRRSIGFLLAQAEFLGRIDGWEFVWDDSNRPIACALTIGSQRECCWWRLVFGP